MLMRVFVGVSPVCTMQHLQLVFTPKAAREKGLQYSALFRPQPLIHLDAPQQASVLAVLQGIAHLIDGVLLPVLANGTDTGGAGSLGLSSAALVASMPPAGGSSPSG